MPKRNFAIQRTKAQDHYTFSFNIRKRIAIPLDKNILQIQQFLQKKRRKDYAKKVSDKILKGESNWYVSKNNATLGQVLEEVVAFYVEHHDL